MVKEIRKIGNSKGIILDAAILDAMHVDVGDKVDITIHAGGAITIAATPTVSEEEFEGALNEVLDDYQKTLSSLA